MQRLKLEAKRNNKVKTIENLSLFMAWILLTSKTNTRTVNGMDGWMDVHRARVESVQSAGIGGMVENRE